MKIKILTFHSELNFGANLQAYALKEFLISKGHDASFINFKRYKNNNIVLSFIRNWVGKTPSSTYLKIKNNIVALSLLNVRRERKKIFEKYQQEHLPRTKLEYCSIYQLKESPPEADVYIVGSDQIWSPEIVSERDFPVYFLDFGSKDIRRISYAASSGGEFFSKNTEQIAQELVSKFSFVGIRESGLVSYLASIGLNKAEWTPDPTFLINWSDQFGFKEEKKLNRIAKFTLAEKNSERAQLLECKLKGTKLFSNVDTYDLANEVLSPFDWVLEIAKSKILITDSYHAVLFSIYTKTPFLFLKWGEKQKRDERVLYLLELFGLEYLAIDEPVLNPETANLLSSLNWSEIENKVTKFRSVGEDFLMKSLS